MSTPLDAMISWFQAQPKEYQYEARDWICSGIASLAEGNGYDRMKPPGNAFVAWMKKPGDSKAILIKTLIARELIRVEFVDVGRSQEYWGEQFQKNSTSCEAFEQGGEARAFGSCQ